MRFCKKFQHFSVEEVDEHLFSIVHFPFSCGERRSCTALDLWLQLSDFVLISNLENCQCDVLFPVAGSIGSCAALFH